MQVGARNGKVDSGKGPGAQGTVCEVAAVGGGADFTSLHEAPGFVCRRKGIRSEHVSPRSLLPSRMVGAALLQYRYIHSAGQTEQRKWCFYSMCITLE